MFYLMDLERTIVSGYAYYWKPNKRGYTRYLVEAGLYDEDTASEIVKDDHDNRTVMISKKTVEKIHE